MGNICAALNCEFCQTRIDDDELQMRKLLSFMCLEKYKQIRHQQYNKSGNQ